MAIYYHRIKGDRGISKRRHVFWYLGLENFLLGLSGSLLGPPLPVVSGDLNISFNKMGIILSLNSFGALIFVLVAGSTLEIFPNRLKRMNEFIKLDVFPSFSYGMNLLGYNGNFAPSHFKLVSDDKKDKIKNLMKKFKLI